ncbi:MAG TPA: Os1348 family NHLP clan protein [Thermoanaerobaculia bacterium]|jgi:hypothetical protein|nr:Os1348 family NHLP clan protein [Thermoanaerobaculia bacterium]
MSQPSVEKLLGRILTDDDFRRSFFPVRAESFNLAAVHGFDLTSVERSALSSLRRRPFECAAADLDARISRSSASQEAVAAGGEGGF